MQPVPLSHFSASLTAQDRGETERKVLVDQSQSDTLFVLGFNTELSRQANAEIPRGIRTSLWMKKLQHVQHLRTGDNMGLHDIF